MTSNNSANDQNVAASTLQTKINLSAEAIILRIGTSTAMTASKEAPFTDALTMSPWLLSMYNSIHEAWEVPSKLWPSTSGRKALWKAVFDAMTAGSVFSALLDPGHGTRMHVSHGLAITCVLALVYNDCRDRMATLTEAEFDEKLAPACEKYKAQWADKLKAFVKKEVGVTDAIPGSRQEKLKAKLIEFLTSLLSTMA